MRPARIIVGHAAVGLTVIAGRLEAKYCPTHGQQFAVEDKPGAGSNLATEYVVNAPPDGYTIFLVTQSNSINATLYSNLNFNFMRDIVVIASLMQAPSLLVVNLRSRSTASQLIAYAKVTRASSIWRPGHRRPPELYGELFKFLTGANMAT